MARVTGRYERSKAGDASVEAYVPHPLPPSDPPLELTGELRTQLHQAERALERLAWLASLNELADGCAPGLSVKEAVVSVAISGSRVGIIDLMTHDAARAGDPDNAPEDADARAVRNCLDAIEFARDTKSGHPQPLNEAHRLLLRNAEDAEPEPVGIRTEQNWIADEDGRATYVPPPPGQLPAALGAFQRYLQTRDGLAPLMRVGLLHAQFDTIHPYLHGNGRMGRLLIAVLLEHWGLLPQPLLHLSAYLQERHEEYSRLCMQRVSRETGRAGWRSSCGDSPAWQKTLPRWCRTCTGWRRRRASEF